MYDKDEKITKDFYNFFDKVKIPMRQVDKKRLKPELEFSEVLLFELRVDNDNLLEYLFKSNLIRKHHITSILNHREVYDYCIKYNRQDLLPYIYLEIGLLDDKILEELLKLPKRNSGLKNCNVIFTPNQINLFLKYKKYGYLTNSKLENFLIEIDGNITLFEKLIDLNVEFDYKAFRSVEVLNILLKKNRFDLISNMDFELNVLLKKADLNDTYLDKILKYFISNNDKIDIKSIVNTIKECNNWELVLNAYFIFLRHNLEKYLKKISLEDLKKPCGNKRVIDKISSFSKDYLQRILSREVFENNYCISYLHIQKSFININDDDFNEFLSISYMKLLKMPNIKLNPLYEKMLNLLKHYLYQTKNQDRIDLEKIINILRVSLYNNPQAIELIQQLIMIKQKEDRKSKKLTFNFNQKRSCFNYDKMIEISKDQEIPIVIHHEIGHLLLNSASLDVVEPYDYDEMIKEVRKDPDLLRRVYEFSKEYNNLTNQIATRVEKDFMNYYDKINTPERRKVIEQFISNNKKELVRYGHSIQYIEKLFSKGFTVDNYIKQERNMIKRNFISIIINSEYGYLTQISDSIDAIFDGEYSASNLEFNGQKIKGNWGHGLSYYYGNPNKMFHENIANYVAIRYEKNRDIAFEKMRKVVGDKFIDYMNDFYNKYIMGKLEAEKSKHVI